ncbi:MAG: SDR family oxidoreductase [Halioglobus sp.]
MSNIVITGANRGIGLELARHYAAQGHKVYACCRDTAGAAELVDLAKTHDVQLVEVSVGDGNSVDSLAEQLSGVTVDILVNNAGTGGPPREEQSALVMDFDGWAETMNINTFAPVRVMQALLPNLRAAETAKVVNITSQMGALSLDMTVAYAYCSSKAALNKFMRMAAIELAGEDILVCLIHPGWVQTDMGGQAADLTAIESAQGIIQTVGKLEASNTGSFWNWNGTTHDW